MKHEEYTYSLGVGVLAAGDVLLALLLDQLVKTAADDVQDGDCQRVS